MQNAGQFGPGTANQVHQQQPPQQQQQAPTQYHPPEPSPTGSSSTTSLRQFRKKDVVEKGPEGAGAQKLEARVAPHSHYPPSHQPPDYRYPPMGHHQYQDYSPNSLGSQPKYDLSENHHSQNSPISTSVIQKPKHMEICQQPPGHLKPTYPHQLGPSGHHQGYAVDNTQIPQSPSQMHSSAYKSAESQYYLKEQYHQIPGHHAQKYHQMMPPQNLRKYQNPGDETFLSKQDTFLSKLSKLNPTMARSIMSEHHLQESLGGQPPAYPGMDQRGIYQNNQRYYPGSMHPSQMGYGSNNYPPVNYAGYATSCNYNRSPNMGAAPPNRYNPQLDRDISPSRRPYSENLHHMAMCATMSQKLPNYPPQYNPPPEYAQHYRHRRDAMQGLPQEYYQQPGAYGRPPQYMGGHQLPSAQGIPDVTESGPVSSSDNLKKFVENWIEEEEIPAETNTNPDGTLNVVGDQIIQVSMVNPSDVPFLENRGIPVVTQEMTTEGYQYLIKTGIDPQMVKIIEANKESGGVVRLHIVDQPKTDCMMANQNQTTQTSDVTDNKKVVVHQNKVIQPFNSNVLTSDFVERIPSINQNLENIGVCQPNNATCSDTKELVDKNCSPINLTDFNENLNNKDLAEARESCIKSVESKPGGSVHSEGSRSPTGSFKSMPIIDAFDSELGASHSNKIVSNFNETDNDNDTNHSTSDKSKDMEQTYQDFDHEAQKLVDSICGEADNANPKYQTHDSILESEAHTANQKLARSESTSSSSQITSNESSNIAQELDLTKSSKTDENFAETADDCRENVSEQSSTVSTPKSSPEIAEKQNYDLQDDNSIQYAPKNFKRKRILSIEDIIYPKSTKENEKLSLFHCTMVFINREKEYSSSEMNFQQIKKEKSSFNVNYTDMEIGLEDVSKSYELKKEPINLKEKYDKSMNVRPNLRKRRARSEPLSSDDMVKKKPTNLKESKKLVSVAVNTEFHNEKFFLNEETECSTNQNHHHEKPTNLDDVAVESTNETGSSANSAIIVINEDKVLHSKAYNSDLPPSQLDLHSTIFNSHIPLDQKCINIDDNPVCLNLRGTRIQIKVGKHEGKIVIKAELATDQEGVDINDNYAPCKSNRSEDHSVENSIDFKQKEHIESIDQQKTSSTSEYSNSEAASTITTKPDQQESSITENMECDKITDTENEETDSLNNSSDQEIETPEIKKDTSIANQSFPNAQANPDHSDLPEKLQVQEVTQEINSTEHNSDSNRSIFGELSVKDTTDQENIEMPTDSTSRIKTECDEEELSAVRNGIVDEISNGNTSGGQVEVNNTALRINERDLNHKNNHVYNCPISENKTASEAVIPDENTGLGVNETKAEQSQEASANQNDEEHVMHHVKYEETESVCSLKLNKIVSPNVYDKMVKPDIKSEHAEAVDTVFMHNDAYENVSILSVPEIDKPSSDNSSSVHREVPSPVEDIIHEAAESEARNAQKTNLTCSESTVSLSTEDKHMDTNLETQNIDESLYKNDSHLAQIEFENNSDEAQLTVSDDDGSSTLQDTLSAEENDKDFVKIHESYQESEHNTANPKPTASEGVELNKGTSNIESSPDETSEETSHLQAQDFCSEQKALEQEISQVGHTDAVLEHSEAENRHFDENCLEEVVEAECLEKEPAETENVEEEPMGTGNTEIIGTVAEVEDTDRICTSETALIEDNLENAVNVEESNSPRDSVQEKVVSNMSQEVEAYSITVEDESNAIPNNLEEIEIESEQIPSLDTEKIQNEEDVIFEYSGEECEDFLEESQESIEISSEISELPQDIIDCPIEDHLHEILVDDPLEGVGLIEEIGRICTSPDHMLEIGPLQDLEVRVKATEEKFVDEEDKVESSDVLSEKPLQKTIDFQTGTLKQSSPKLREPSSIPQEVSTCAVPAPFKKSRDVVILSPTSTYNEDGVIPSYKQRINNKRRDSNECSSTCSAPLTKAAKKQYDSDLQSTAISTTSAVLETPTSTGEPRSIFVPTKLERSKACPKEVQVNLEKLDIKELLSQRAKAEAVAKNRNQLPRTYNSNVRKIFLDLKRVKKPKRSRNEAAVTPKPENVESIDIERVETQYETGSKKCKNPKRSKRIDKNLKYKLDQKELLKKLVALRIAKGKAVPQDVKLQTTGHMISVKNNKQKTNVASETETENHKKPERDDDDYADFTELVKRHKEKKKKMQEMKSQKVKPPESKPTVPSSDPNTTIQKESQTEIAEINQDNKTTALDCEKNKVLEQGTKKKNKLKKQKDVKTVEILNNERNKDLKITLKITEESRGISKIPENKLSPPTKYKNSNDHYKNESTTDLQSKIFKPKKVRHIRKPDTTDDEKDPENIVQTTENEDIEEGEIEHSEEDKNKDHEDQNIVQPIEIMSVPLVKPTDSDTRRNKIVVPSVSELLDENKSSSKRKISLQDYKKKRKIDLVNCSSETDSKSEAESPQSSNKEKKPKLDNEKLNQGVHLAKSLSFEEVLPSSVEKNARKIDSNSARRKSVDFSTVQIISDHLTVEYSLEGKRMDPRLKIRKKYIEELSKKDQVQSYFTGPALEENPIQKVDNQRMTDVVQKSEVTCTKQTPTPRNKEVLRPQSEEPKSVDLTKSPPLQTAKPAVKPTPSSETTNKILLNSSNEWEDTNSPKHETETTDDCLNINFSGLIVKNSRPIIDVDELKLTIDPEYNVEHGENENSAHPISLEEYREKIDSELSSLSINIPKSSRESVKQYTTFNLEDIKRPVDQNEVVQKFLNGDDISKTELEIITKLITYKRMMSQTKDYDSLSASSGSITQRYELKNPGDDRMKLHFRKLNKRKVEPENNSWEENVPELNRPSLNSKPSDEICCLKTWEEAPSTTPRKPGDFDCHYRIKEPSQLKKREADPRRLDDYSVQMQYSSPEKNRLPKIIFKRTKTTEEPVVVLERLAMDNVKDKYNLSVNGT